MSVSSPAPEWLRDRLEELAADVGRLRRGTTSDWRVEGIADRIWWLLAATTPTAADLFTESGDVETSLAEAERETRRLNRLLGADLKERR